MKTLPQSTTAKQAYAIRLDELDVVIDSLQKTANRAHLKTRIATWGSVGDISNVLATAEATLSAFQATAKPAKTTAERKTT